MAYHDHLNKQASTILDNKYMTDALMQGFHRLNLMEYPFSLEAELQSQWLQYLSKVKVNRYPDTDARELKLCIKRTFSIPENLDIVLANGSMELLQILATAFISPQATVMSPAPSFFLYERIVKAVGLNYVEVPLTQDFELDVPLLKQKITQYNPAMLLFAYPNNPTGNLFSKADLVEIIQYTNALVIIDEAYYPYSDDTLIEFVSTFENVAVCRSLSKIGFAGLRLGYLIGKGRIIEHLKKITLPFLINSLTQQSAIFFLENLALFEKKISEISTLKKSFIEKINSETTTFKAFDSHANFIPLRVAQGRAKDLIRYLHFHKILINLLDGSHPLLKDFVRFSIGNREECQLLLLRLVQFESS